MKEKETLEQSVQDQNDTIESLEKQLSQAKENEKLLIMYPDLNGPVNSQLNGMPTIFFFFKRVWLSGKNKKVVFTSGTSNVCFHGVCTNAFVVGTGDIALDMENQVKANMRRIMALEEQNATLRKSITKVIETQSRAPKEVNISKNCIPKSEQTNRMSVNIAWRQSWTASYYKVYAKNKKAQK